MPWIATYAMDFWSGLFILLPQSSVFCMNARHSMPTVTGRSTILAASINSFAPESESWSMMPAVASPLCHAIYTAFVGEYGENEYDVCIWLFTKPVFFGSGIAPVMLRARSLARASSLFSTFGELSSFSSASLNIIFSPSRHFSISCPPVTGSA